MLSFFLKLILESETIFSVTVLEWSDFSDRSLLLTNYDSSFTFIDFSFMLHFSPPIMYHRIFFSLLYYLYQFGLYPFYRLNNLIH